MILKLQAGNISFWSSLLHSSDFAFTEEERKEVGFHF